jgi:hypothetical protein
MSYSGKELCILNSGTGLKEVILASFTLQERSSVSTGQETEWNSVIKRNISLLGIIFPPTSLEQIILLTELQQVCVIPNIRIKHIYRLFSH